MLGRFKGARRILLQGSRKAFGQTTRIFVYFRLPLISIRKCALLSYYAVSCGNFLQMFRGSLSFPSSSFKKTDS